jgi:hypothetical protein
MIGVFSQTNEEYYQVLEQARASVGGSEQLKAYLEAIFLIYAHDAVNIKNELGFSLEQVQQKKLDSMQNMKCIRNIFSELYGSSQKVEINE